MQLVIPNSEYSFDASSNTVTLTTPFHLLSAEQIFRITNLTVGAILYDPERRTHPITMSAGVISLTYDNTNMADTDILQIMVDTGAENISRTVFVSPSFIDDEIAQKFSTIQAAITFIHDSTWYSELGPEQQSPILVYPGEYKEQLTCWNYIRVISTADRDNQGDTKTVQICPPDDKKTEAILVSGVDYIYNFSGVTFTADSVVNGPYANAINARFYNCRFNNGSFLDGSQTHACGLLFVGCTFNAPTPINYTGARGHADREIYMYDSWGYADIIVESTFATGSPYLEMQGCHFKAKLSVGAAWSVQATRCRFRNFTGAPNRNNFNTSGSVNFAATTISGGAHFVSDPGSVSIEHCNFSEYGATVIVGADITADTAITSVEYIHNVQQNGISGNIRIDCPIKPVGCEAVNRYYSIQDAIDSITTTGVVDLRESLTGLSELSISSSTNVTIDGHKLYSLSFTGDVVQLGTSEELVFYGLSNLSGGVIEVSGNNAYVGFEECLTIAAHVILTSGTNSYCLIYTSTIKAPAGYPAVTLNNADTITVMGYSRVQGSSGHPAMLTTIFAVNKLKAKFSTLIHGSGSTNAPLIYTGVGKIDISVYSCGLNAAWDSADYNNLIGTANNTTDPGITF